MAQIGLTGVATLMVFSLTLWLGLYLLARDFSNRQLRLAGLGLTAYAVVLAGQMVQQTIEGPAGQWLAWGAQRLLVLPALLWTGVLVDLLPPDSSLRPHLMRFWYGQWVLALVSFFVHPLLLTLAVLVPLVIALSVALWVNYQERSPLGMGLLLVATVLFGLGMVALLLPLTWLTHPFTVFVIGIDLLVLGYAVAVLDAFDLGEALLPDMAYSLDASLLTALLFGGLVALAMAAGAGPVPLMLTLLLAMIALAVATQTFANPIQSGLERLAFASRPQLRAQRSATRVTASALPKIQPEPGIDKMVEAEFVRLTRRALSHYGDLPRLATSPLNQMEILSDRLAQRGATDTTLERAAELKSLLTEAIAQLKPDGPDEFGSSEEWRHYNALYFPYVLGLRPYNQRTNHAKLAPAAREALEWFRTYVPERTLYNWQNGAAQLVAQYLRELQPKS